jgi:FtsH-binding integral membrane protein
MSGFAAPLESTVATQGFLRRVFTWMFLGLLMTGLVAALVGSSDSFLTDMTDNPLILLLVFGGQLALVFTIAGAINRLSPATALTLFFVYAALNGVIFSFIFELYTAQSIFTTFLVTAAMFGTLALIGATTKTDLTKLGPILFAALIAFLIATVVNIFVGSDGLYWITTYAGILIFAGLTAYDMQKLKNFAAEGGADETTQERAAIVGALSLYLDFINLFLLLLRLFGQQR